MWPGRARSLGRVAGSISAWMVAARSYALIPVVVPCRKSTLMVNAVRWLSVLAATMSGRSSSSMRSPVIGTHMSPEVWVRKKAMFSGVAASAAMMRSPSFSRSSSSTTTTISPLAMAAMAFSTLANPIACLPLPSGQQLLDVFGDQVDLQVDPVPRSLDPQRRHLGGVRDDRNGETVGQRLHHGQAAPVHGDRPLLHDISQQLGRRSYAQPGRGRDHRP